MPSALLNLSLPTSSRKAIIGLIVVTFLARSLLNSSAKSVGKLAIFTMSLLPLTLQGKSQFTMDAAKSSTKVDILTASATDLLSLLNAKAITSEKLVELYLEQIEKQNRKGAKLHAMISTVPSDLLREIAKERDKQRFLAKDPANLGPLHGIPFVVKVRCQS